MRWRLVFVGCVLAGLGILLFASLSAGQPFVLTSSTRLPDRIAYADRTYEHNGDDACEPPRTASAGRRLVHVQDVFVVFGSDLPVYRVASDPTLELPASLVVERHPGCEVWFSLLGGP